ncbi:hypothetical protein pdam_00014933 [Pocillopora damicornis]|uniref:Mitochondrial fission 1 protein n=1 Tax=Pocillopora damicornis TaxID=46731 RepID=A0A3M6US37_POCDA|nr:hypothetical protein pdam_00014933 [Pocillopora damicornis]
MDEILSEGDAKRFEDKYNAEVERGQVSSDTQFSYAWCLIKSSNKSEILKGVLLLQGENYWRRVDAIDLVTPAQCLMIGHMKNPGLCHSGTDQRDYLYFIAEGYYKLNEYKSALRYTNRLLQIEPENRQGLELHEKITGQMKKDGLIGLGILGGTALVMGGAAALVGMVFASRK